MEDKKRMVKEAHEWAAKEIEKSMIGEEEKKKIVKTPFLVTNEFIAEQCYIEERKESFFMVRYFDSSELKEVESIDLGDTVYEPLVNPTLKKSLVLLPRKPESCNLRQVFNDAVDLALKFYDCEEEKLEELKLLVLTTVGTWFLDKFNMIIPGIGGFAPIIAIRGPSGSGKDRLMNALRLLSYRPFYDVSTRRIPSLYRPLDQWRGTLCLSEMNFPNTRETSELTHYLNCRCYGVPISRQNPDNPKVNEVFHNFGLTIVTQRRAWEDNALEDRSLPFYCERTRKEIPTEVLDEYVEQGRRLQDKLLYLRLNLFSQVQVDKATRIRGIRDHRLIAAMLIPLALAKIEPDLKPIIEDVITRIEKRRKEVKAVSTDGIIINMLYDRWKEGLIGEWNGCQYIAKERIIEEDGKGNKATVLIPLQINELAEELKFSSGAGLRRILNSLQLHPQGERLPRVIKLKRSYRPIWVSESRLKSRFDEFVPDYEPSAETTTEEKSVTSVTSVTNPPLTLVLDPERQLVTQVTEVTENTSVKISGRQEEKQDSATTKQPVSDPSVNPGTKERVKAYGAEGQPCVFCGKPGGGIRLRNGKIFYAHDECLSEDHGGA